MDLFICTSFAIYNKDMNYKVFAFNELANILVYFIIFDSHILLGEYVADIFY